MNLNIPSLIEAAGGEIIGKVRLQKLVYLLSQLGVETQFAFSYHHYGPYSAELADAVEDDIVFRRVSAEERRRADGVPFVIYRSLVTDGNKDTKKILNAPPIKSALSTIQKQTATVLELAATIHWLAFVEEIPDWRAELVRRKGVKTEQGRAEVALALLQDLNIAPTLR